jgi:hypothetical protein
MRASSDPILEPLGGGRGVGAEDELVETAFGDENAAGDGAGEDFRASAEIQRMLPRDRHFLVGIECRKVVARTATLVIALERRLGDAAQKPTKYHHKSLLINRPGYS